MCEVFSITRCGIFGCVCSVWHCHKEQGEGQASVYIYLCGMLLKLELGPLVLQCLLQSYTPVGKCMFIVCETQLFLFIYLLFVLFVFLLLLFVYL